MNIHKATKSHHETGFHHSYTKGRKPWFMLQADTRAEGVPPHADSPWRYHI